MLMKLKSGEIMLKFKRKSVKYFQFAQDEKTIDDKNEEGSSEIEKSVYRKINCEYCGNAFENLEIQEKCIIEEYE